MKSSFHLTSHSHSLNINHPSPSQQTTPSLHYHILSWINPYTTSETRKKKLKKKKRKLKYFFFLITLFLQGIISTLAQTPAQAPAPGPAGPTNVTAILAKAGQFTTLIRLMESTQVADQINTQLNNSNQGLTIFAPTDNAFSSLKAGMLNSLTDQQKVQLVQFHVLPDFLSLQQFQTASNPLRTQAGNSNNGEFPLNVTTSGNQVNITTGVVNTTVSNSIYSDGQLVVYQVDQVLLPLEFFQSPAPSPSPIASAAPKKKGKEADPSDGDSDSTADSSAASDLTSRQKAAFWLLLPAAAAAILLV